MILAHPAPGQSAVLLMRHLTAPAQVVTGLAASSSAVLASHIIGVIITSISLSVSLWNLQRHKGHGPGPLLLAIFAAPLLLANSVVNLAEDIGRVPNNYHLNALLNTMTVLGIIQLLAATL
jgi:hypothetical protein